MIVGRLIQLELEDPADHLATTWQISDDSSFQTVLAESVDDTVNLDKIVFTNIFPEYGKKYYGRARVRTRLGGWSVWNNLDVFTSENYDAIDNVYTLPSRISSPRMSSCYSKKSATSTTPDLNQHPVVDFSIEATGYSVVTNSKHIATSWYIETMSGDVIWKSEYSLDDLESVYVPNILLEHGAIYRFRACFHNETGDTSDISSYTVYTTPIKNIALRAFLEFNLIQTRQVLSEDIDLNLPFDSGIQTIDIEILRYNSFGCTKIFEDSVSEQSKLLHIPANTLSVNSNYVVKYRTSQTDEWEALYFPTYR